MIFVGIFVGVNVDLEIDTGRVVDVDTDIEIRYICINIVFKPLYCTVSPS